MAIRPAKAKAYCSYCWRHVSVTEDDRLYQHKPTNQNSVDWGLCPGMSMEPLEKDPGVGTTPFRRDVKAGLWEEVPNLKGRQYAGAKQNGTAPLAGPSQEVENLRKEATDMIDKMLNGDQHVFDKEDVLTLLGAFLSLPEKAAAMAAEAAGAQPQVGVKDAEGWFTPDGDRLYTKGELDADVPGKSFDEAVDDEVQKLLAEMTDDDMALRTASLLKEVDDLQKRLEVQIEANDNLAERLAGRAIVDHPEQSEISVGKAPYSNRDVVEMVITAFKTGVEMKPPTVTWGSWPQ